MNPNQNMITFQVSCLKCESNNIQIIDEDEEMNTVTLKCKSCGNVEVLK